jgi:hypothetical protein
MHNIALISQNIPIQLLITEICKLSLHQILVRAKVSYYSLERSIIKIFIDEFLTA